MFFEDELLERGHEAITVAIEGFDSVEEELNVGEIAVELAKPDLELLEGESA